MIINIQTFEKYTEKNFRNKFSNSSLPSELSEELLLSLGYATLYSSTTPDIKRTEQLIEVGPKEIDGKWYTQYEIKPIEFINDDQKNVFIKSWKNELISKAATDRYQKETNGITFNNIRIKTDRESQSQLLAAVNTLSLGFINSIDWKTEDGTFINLDLNEIKLIAKNVSKHVQSCFTSEKVQIEKINSLKTIEDFEKFQL